MCTTVLLENRLPKTKSLITVKLELTLTKSETFRIENWNKPLKIELLEHHFRITKIVADRILELVVPKS